METNLLKIPQGIYDELLSIFMPSEDMRSFLKTKSLSDDQLRWMMLGSTVNLYLKREWMKKLSEYETDPDADMRMSPDGKWRYGCHYSEVADEIDKAIYNLENVGSGEILVLEDCWYDYDILEEKSVLEGTFVNAEEVKELIRKVIREEHEDDDPDEQYDEFPEWRRLTKWSIDGNKLLYTYYFLQDEVVWFVDEERNGAGVAKSDEMAYLLKLSWNGLCLDPFFRSEFLVLPIPYAPGDIIEINTYPFGPKQNAIIYEICDGGRIVEIITRDYRGRWIDSGLFYGRYGRFREQDDYTSPLYRIRNAKVTDPEEQRVFNRIAEFINGDNERGERLYTAIFHDPDIEEGVSADGLLGFLDRLEALNETRIRTGDRCGEK